MTGFDGKMKALNVESIYRGFVRTYGHCGFAQYVVCPVEPRFPLGAHCLVSLFYGLRPDRRYLLAEEHARFRGRMPHHLLPIAKDPGGNQFVLSVGSHDHRAVYYWDHDRVDLPKARVQEMADDLQQEGLDTSRLFIDGIVLAWEDRHRDVIGHRPGYGNLYRVAGSFAEFIDSLRAWDPDEPEATGR